jgi:hypothetical protein
MLADKQTHGNVAMPDSKLLAKNIMGSFMILLLAIVSIGTLLLPNLGELLKLGVSSIGESAAVLAGVLIVGFLLTVPTTWFIQALMDYRNARDLDRFGSMTKGSVLEKWIDASNGKPTFHVRYKYLLHLTAMQIVNRDTFQQLQCNENIFVLYLDNLPHISRLDLD